VEDEVRPNAPVPGDVGYLLHSWKMQFPHPYSQEVVRIVCNPPGAFKKFMSDTLLQKYNF